MSNEKKPEILEYKKPDILEMKGKRKCQAESSVGCGLYKMALYG